MFVQFFQIGIHGKMLPLEKALDGGGKAGVGDAMGGMGAHRIEAPGKLVGALGATFKTGQPLLDGKFDHLVRTALEVQTFDCPNSAPVPPVQIAATTIQDG